jgi:hypothetical protein
VCYRRSGKVAAAAVKLNAMRANGRRICGNASGMRGGIDGTEAFAIDHQLAWAIPWVTRKGRESEESFAWRRHIVAGSQSSTAAPGEIARFTIS